MNNANYGKILFILLFTVCLTVLFAVSENITVANNPSLIQLGNNTDLGFEVHYRIDNLKIDDVQTRNGTFNTVSIEGYGNSNRIGDPSLPMMRKLIAVPLGAEVRFTITGQQSRLLNAEQSKLKYNLMPVQESVSKSADPATIPFMYNEKAYKVNGFNNDPVIRIEELGMLRGVRLFAIDFEPVKYNPVTKSLNVFYDYSIRVDFDHPDLLATADLLAKTASWEFDRLYNNAIMNWQNNDRTSIVRYPTKYVILAPATFNATLANFINWKKQQGYYVTLQNVGSSGGEVANTTTAIKAYLQNLWNIATAPDPAPTYVLFVGDTGQLVTNTGATGTHPTDLTYVRLNGTDYVPEMYYGRFSATTTTELQNIIDKTITFEKTTMPSLTYLGEDVLIAGADATYGPTHGNGQINYGTVNYFNAANGITCNTYLYPASASSDAAIIANANAGRGIINYTAHGSETGWADPTFSVTDANAMTNTNEWGLMIGNCCLTNKFDYATCFGEALIRGANKGAVAYIGGNNNTYWDEDYWWGVGAKGTATGTAPAYNASTLGVYDGMFHTHSEAVTDWCQTAGDMIYMGNLAVTQGASSRINYYWEIYAIMGDPSMMPYMGVPPVNTVSYPSQILIGATSVTVTGEAQSRVAITMGGVLYGTGIIPTGGSLTLTITPFTAVGTADIVITRTNRRTAIGTISIIPNSGAYVSLSSWTYSDSNNNTAEYNETGRFSVTLQNVGSVTATNINAVLSTTNGSITITDNTESVASLAAGASVTLTNAYQFNIANNIVDQTSVPFTLTMTSGTSTWNGNIALSVNAPALAFGNMTISDPSGNNNGRLDPGETVSITIPLNNSGHAASIAGNATMSCTTTGITVNTGSGTFTAISASGNASLAFSITAAASMTVGTVVNLTFNATAGAYTATKNDATTVGLIIEDFETGNFSAFPWVFSGNANWTIVNTGAHAGTYAAKSGTILASQSTTLQQTRTVTTAGNITFWYSVSSESGYDYLKFYIDDVLQTSSWSGTVAWAQGTYAVTTGSHTFKWTYSKDGSVDTGSDCAWVDDIIFPASTGSFSFNPPQNLTATGSHAKVALAWQAPSSGTPSSYKVFRNSSLLTTVTALTYNDTAVTNGTLYSYYVTAVYTSPNAGESAASNTVSATPSALPPQNLVGVGGNNLVNLTWQAPSAGTPGGYKIYKNSILLTTTTSLAYTDNAVSNGTSYSYYVTATYTSPTAESPASNTVSVTPNTISTITIGTGTSTQRQPFGMYWGYERDAALYLSSEINSTGSISSLGWYVATSQTTAAPVVIRMMTTTSTSLTSTTWATMIASATTVYSASTSFTTTGWKTINLTTPFNYTSGNLVVLIETTYGGTGTGTYPYFRYTTAGTGTHQVWYADNSAPTGNGTLNTYRPNLQLTLGNQSTTPVFAVNPTSLAFGDVFVSSSAVLPISISNAGGAALSGNITTPTGYSVAQQARTDNDNNGITLSSSESKDARNTLAYTVPAGSSVVFNITFAPTAVQSYNGNITITSNDTNNPNNNVSVTGAGSNSAQVIIGTGTTIDQHLPIEPYYGYTYSQTVYYQSEINISNRRISKISWYYNGNSAWSNDAFKIWMGHTTTTAFASTTAWIPTSSMTLVYDGTISAPATAGWVELTLTTPFTYNNTQNLVVAVDENTIGYHLSADDFYCTPVTGNRSIYYYSDTTNPDPAAPIAAMATPAYIPNTRLLFEELPSSPVINVTPTSLAFGDIAVGTSSILPVTIENTGGQTLTGNFTTPAGYFASQTSGRNTINYSIAAGSSQEYNIYFSPTAAQSYDAIMAISSNAPANPTVNVTLTGTGFIPPTIGLNTTELTSSLPSGETQTQQLIISNTGGQNLIYSITLEELRSGTINPFSTADNSSRSITGSSLTTNITEYLSGTTTDIIFTAANASTDSEWLEDVSVTFPAGITVNSSTNLVGGSGGDLVSNGVTGAGTTLVWHGEDTSGWGLIYGGESAVATVNVTFSPTATGDQTLSYTITGDIYGAEPHTLTDVIVLTSGTPPLTWLSCSPMSGTVLPGQNAIIDVEFNAFNMETGIYNAMITVTSNDPVNAEASVDVVMDVTGGNHSPVINLPAQFTWEKNGTLEVDFTPYVSDADADPLTLSYTCDSNINVQIAGMLVTLSSDWNWFGNSNVTFSVSDGQATAEDIVQAVVTPTNVPNWTPVVYPNNPATVYGIVTINGTPAPATVTVAAFSGEECRGVEDVFIDGGLAYITMLVNLNTDGETISFKLYDELTDSIYYGDTYPVMNYGEIFGLDTPYPINGLPFVSPPVLDLEVITGTTSTDMQLGWQPVASAVAYNVYRSNNPYNGFVLIATVTDPNFTDPDPGDINFYYITAVDVIPGRGENK